MLSNKLQNVILSLWITIFFVCPKISAKTVPLSNAITSPQKIGNESADSKKFTNRLSKENSSYLLEYADNPVDWYAWGQEAFDKALRENKPIFLSIGHSNSLWCKAMKDESFSNNEIAAIMNQNFVNIKVDRDSMPEVDRVYMRFIQETTGNGGWPVNVWLTPDLKPFFGGTYFPPESIGKKPSFSQVLMTIANLWKNEPDNVQANTKEFLSILSKNNLGPITGKIPDNKVLDKAYDEFCKYFDQEAGGFGTAPKFPRPSELSFLLHYSTLPSTPESKRLHAREMVYKTIRGMEAGGIHDHLRGGFHPYAKDRNWQLPPFEKTLYDQAEIASVCMDAFQITQDDFYKKIAYKTLRYTLLRLAHPQGGFYSGEKAVNRISFNSNETANGAYSLWTYSEFKDAFRGQPEFADNEKFKKEADEKLSLAIDFFNVHKEGNIPELLDPNNELASKNILWHTTDLEKFAKERNMSLSSLLEKIDDIKTTLSFEQKKRPASTIDEQIITAWNGEMISVMARASLVLDDSLFLSSAAGSSKFIGKTLFDENKERLFRSYQSLRSETGGSLQDYAYLISGLLELYQADGDINWLKNAVELQDIQDQLFWDNEKGGYFTASNKVQKTIVLLKEDYDGAIPSAVSVSAFNLIKIGRMLQNQDMIKKAEIIMRIYSPILESNPTAMPHMLSALTMFLSPAQQIVIASDAETKEESEIQAFNEMRKSIYSVYQPNTVLLHADKGRGQYYLNKRIKDLQSMKMIDNNPTAYVCENFIYKEPTTNIKKLISLLNSQQALSPLAQ
jgi:uncharacterized protein